MTNGASASSTWCTRAGQRVHPKAVMAFVKAQFGSVEAPKQIEVWDDLQRSKVGKVTKPDIRAKLLAEQRKG
ncbi:hypothetical protein [Bradyrhizobium mercantei]|uniref:hypothetical protein n=1 Tax=Bradyrhizobium mercantei TaxID=1904807 RepID=UPI00157C9AAC|nr:hypothetical protein [Bradyrhizobium mercantei]